MVFFHIGPQGWWICNHLENQSDYDIYGQRFDADGSKDGQEFRVNATTSNSQYDPVVATLEDGSFVIVEIG